MEITDVNTVFGAYPAQHADSSPETLTEAMRANGIDWGLTLSTYGLFYDAAEGNGETMRACRTHDHLIPVATLNPAHYWGQDGVVESIAENAFEMVRFFPAPARLAFGVCAVFASAVRAGPAAENADHGQRRSSAATPRNWRGC